MSGYESILRRYVRPSLGHLKIKELNYEVFEELDRALTESNCNRSVPERVTTVIRVVLKPLFVEGIVIANFGYGYSSYGMGLDAPPDSL